MIPIVWEIDTEVSTKGMIDDRGGGSTETAENPARYWQLTECEKPSSEEGKIQRELFVNDNFQRRLEIFRIQSPLYTAGALEGHRP
jgi:hypothetical protein